MGYYPILKTTWKYFPEKKGFLTGLILCVFGLCPFVFTSIADAIINPNGESMLDNYYSPNISIKMKDFALIMSITMGICGIISQILMFPMDNIISTDKNNDKSNEKSKSNENNVEKLEEENNKNEEDISNEKSKNNENKVEKLEEENNKNEDNEPFIQAFKSLRFHLFNLMSVGTLCNILF